MAQEVDTGSAWKEMFSASGKTRLLLAAVGLGRRFKQEARGAAAVEFALIGLVSLELLVEVLQVGVYFYTSAAVERATAKASRAIMIGTVNSQNITQTQFLSQILCPAISATNLACANTILNVQDISEGVSPSGYYALVNPNQTALVKPPLNNQQTSYCPGISQSYVFVQVLYAMPVFSQFWKLFATNFNGAPSYILQSTSAFRNEPFHSQSQSC